MAGAVRRGAGSERRRAFAILGRHAAEGTLVDFAALRSAERQAVMLKLVHGGGSVAAQILDGVLVAEPVDPFTVSYMCQRQSSRPIFPRAAAMPPCAATVCERVGNTLVTQAVLSPASAQPSVARSPAPPAPMTTTSKEWVSTIGAPVHTRRPAVLSVRSAVRLG